MYKYVRAVRQSFEERPIELPNQSTNPIKIIGWLPNGPTTKMTIGYFCLLWGEFRYRWNPLGWEECTWHVYSYISCKFKKSNQYKQNHMITTPKHSVCLRAIFGWQWQKFIILHCQYETAFMATVWCVICIPILNRGVLINLQIFNKNCEPCIKSLQNLSA